MRLPRWRSAVLVALVALLQGCGATLLRTSCDNPRISNFGAPSSYIVMLPYRYGGDDDTKRDLAQQLNRITRLQALQGAIQMPDTQITLVEGNPALPNDPQCDIENVYDRVVENRSGWFWRKPFHSAVFVWGEIFDSGDGLIVQSHLRMFWNGSAARDLEVSVDSPALVRPLRFGGDLPSDTISFPARTLTRAIQEQLARNITAGLQVRAAPNLEAAQVELPSRFMTMRFKRPWLELQRRDLSSVWLLIDEGGLGAAPVPPETLFARAMASYLNFRVTPDRAARQQAVDALSRFRGVLATVNDPGLRVPLAVADVIEGTLGLAMRQDGPLGSDVNATQGNAQAEPQTFSARSQTALDDAVRRLPTNGDVLNLAAIVRIPGCCSGDGVPARIEEIERLLNRAEALEQGNLKIASNRLSWYSYLATLPDSSLPYTRAELAHRKQLAEAALAAWKALVP